MESNVHKFFAAASEPKRRIKILFRDVKDAELFQFAYAMAYFTLVSLVPSLILIFSLMSLFSPMFGENSAFINKLRDFLLDNLAAASGPQVLAYLDEVIKRVNIRTLGLTGFLGTTVALILLLQKIELALNRIFAVEVKRNLFARFIYFWTILTLGTFLIGLTIGVFSGFGFDEQGMLAISRNPLAGRLMYFIGLVIFFALLYKIVPNRSVKTKHALWGAVFATTLISIAVQLFATYSRLFANYEAIYGAALSALPIFLLWLYINWVMILLGAQLVRRLQLGFDVDEETYFFGDISEGESRYSEHIFRSHLPFIILWEIYKGYRRGDFKGFFPVEFSQRTGIPEPWIAEALSALCDQDYLVMMRSPSNDKSLVYFPSKNDENVLLSEFFSKMRVVFEEKLSEIIERLEMGPVVSSCLKAPLDVQSTFADLFVSVKS